MNIHIFRRTEFQVSISSPGKTTPTVEYTAAVWSPYKSSDIENIENVPPHVENCLPKLENLNKQMFLSESIYGTSAW